jgi:hypothetical protein
MRDRADDYLRFARDLRVPFDNNQADYPHGSSRLPAQLSGPDFRRADRAAAPIRTGASVFGQRPEHGADDGRVRRAQRARARRYPNRPVHTAQPVTATTFSTVRTLFTLCMIASGLSSVHRIIRPVRPVALGDEDHADGWYHR